MRERWKAAREGNEIVSETIRLQGAGARKGDRVPIEEWAYEYIVCRLLKGLWSEGTGKPSLNRAPVAHI